MAKFKVLAGVFGGKRAGEEVELATEHGAYYVKEGLLEVVAEVKAEPKKPATRKKTEK